jgi:hypothetical protein
LFCHRGDDAALGEVPALVAALGPAHNVASDSNASDSDHNAPAPGPAIAVAAAPAPSHGQVVVLPPAQPLQHAPQAVQVVGTKFT